MSSTQTESKTGDSLAEMFELYTHSARSFAEIVDNDSVSLLVLSADPIKESIHTSRVSDQPSL
jgi:hypothetical protein